ncbi:hypothetical protein BJ508DRAFT_342199 [Ascobolus immersus RN42]|uniref:Uncharacterized protein n=1 Tax=Ascobolus immersus RN42 TaxID=1160509 RepID=A0A3N4J0L1_ASCIM|nr:hypothetical protein BJ508DRAFT_342199 [Ascobolus immersus RN42]
MRLLEALTTAHIVSNEYSWCCISIACFVQRFRNQGFTDVAAQMKLNGIATYLETPAFCELRSPQTGHEGLQVTSEDFLSTNKVSTGTTFGIVGLFLRIRPSHVDRSQSSVLVHKIRHKVLNSKQWKHYHARSTTSFYLVPDKPFYLRHELLFISESLPVPAMEQVSSTAMWQLILTLGTIGTHSHAVTVRA